MRGRLRDSEGLCEGLEKAPEKRASDSVILQYGVGGCRGMHSMPSGHRLLVLGWENSARAR